MESKALKIFVSSGRNNIYLCNCNTLLSNAGIKCYLHILLCK